MIRALNHAVLYVRDAERTAGWYHDVLGFRTVMQMPGACFLQAPDSDNDHDLGLFSIGDAAVGLTGGPRRCGRPVPPGLGGGDAADLAAVRDRLEEAGALVGSSDHGSTKSLYGQDPDGLEFEVVWLIPHDLLTDADREARSRIGHLDLEAEIARFGPDTLGATSVPA